MRKSPAIRFLENRDRCAMPLGSRTMGVHFSWWGSCTCSFTDHCFPWQWDSDTCELLFGRGAAGAYFCCLGWDIGQVCRSLGGKCDIYASLLTHIMGNLHRRNPPGEDGCQGGMILGGVTPPRGDCDRCAQFLWEKSAYQWYSPHTLLESKRYNNLN